MDEIGEDKTFAQMEIELNKLMETKIFKKNAKTYK